MACQTPAWQAPGAFALDKTPAVLLQPAAFDWTFHRVGGRQIASGREAHLSREVLAYPTASNWTGGLNLTALGCAAGDSVPNGMATVFATGSTPATLRNKVFMLTKKGKLIRVDRASSGDFSTLGLSGTFSRTYVTLSPSARYAYVVSDDGMLFVVDTIAMQVKDQHDLGAKAIGCAPVFDPYTAQHNGSQDEVYVPDNAGYVSKFTRTGANLSGQTKYAVAITTTPTDGGTAKIEAPAVVLDGVIYVGDQGGAFHVYDTANAANNAAYFTGSPIDTAPAIEIQDGSYAVTQPDGTPKSVALGTPVYAFVNSGANCFWVDLHALTSTRSMSLYLDDFTPTKQFGYLHDYTYNNSTTDVPLTLTDWCAIRTDHNTQLAGAAAGQNKTKTWIAAGEVDAWDGDNNLSGGPVVCYLKFSTGTSGTAVVKKAELSLTVENGGWTKLPEFRAAPSSFLKGTSTVWSFPTLTNANRPDWNTEEIGQLLTGVGVNGWGNSQLNPGTRLIWDISEGFEGTPASDYTLVYMYDQNKKVLWEPGDKSGDNGQKADLVEGTQFRTPSAGNAGHRPVFTVKTSIGSFPTPTIETPPVLDVYRKKVYVFYSNTMYAISFANKDAFEDRDPATKKTLFNTTRLGRNATIGGLAYNGGAAYAPTAQGDTKFVNNRTAPVFNYNLTYAYMLDRFPEDPDSTSPGAWDYGVSKISLAGFTGAADALQKPAAALPFVNNVTGEASNFMVIDPFSDVGTTGGNIFFGLGNGKVYQFDR